MLAWDLELDTFQIFTPANGKPFFLKRTFGFQFTVCLTILHFIVELATENVFTLVLFENAFV